MAFFNRNGFPGDKKYFRTFLPLNGFYTNGSLSGRTTGHHITCESSSGGQWHDSQGNMVEGKPDGCIRNNHNKSTSCGAIFRSNDDQGSHLWMFPHNGFANRVLQCRIRGSLVKSLGIFITDGSEFNSVVPGLYQFTGTCINRLFYVHSNYYLTVQDFVCFAMHFYMLLHTFTVNKHESR